MFTQSFSQAKLIRETDRYFIVELKVPKKLVEQPRHHSLGNWVSRIAAVLECCSHAPEFHDNGSNQEGLRSAHAALNEISQDIDLIAEVYSAIAHPKESVGQECS